MQPVVAQLPVGLVARHYQSTKTGQFVEFRKSRGAIRGADSDDFESHWDHLCQVAEDGQERISASGYTGRDRSKVPWSCGFSYDFKLGSFMG